MLVAHHTRGRLEASAGLVRRIERGRRRHLAAARRVERPAPAWCASVAAGHPRPRTRSRWSRRATWSAVGAAGGGRRRRPAADAAAGGRPGRSPPLTVVGDIMLGRGRRRGRPAGRPGGGAAPAAAHLAAADLTVGNLESTLSDDGPPQQGGDSFAADPGGRGRPGPARAWTPSRWPTTTPATTARARCSPRSGRCGRARWTAFGAGADLAAAEPAGGAASTAACGSGSWGSTRSARPRRPPPGTPGALSVRMPPRTGPLNQCRPRGTSSGWCAGSTVGSTWWSSCRTGATSTPTSPSPVQSLVARRLAAAGADLVAGGHPHWVQGLERAGDAVVAHSLGNLVFDMDFMEQTMEGVTLTATFWGDRLIGRRAGAVPDGRAVRAAPDPRCRGRRRPGRRVGREHRPVQLVADRSLGELLDPGQADGPRPRRSRPARARRCSAGIRGPVHHLAAAGLGLDQAGRLQHVEVLADRLPA